MTQQPNQLSRPTALPSPTIVLAVMALLAAGGCATDPVASILASSGTPPPPQESASDAIRPMSDVPDGAALESGAYSVDPDGDPATAMRVTFTVDAPGWSAWVGTYKQQADAADGRGVVLTVADPTHVVNDACRQETWTEPGPGVDDLADALATISGYELMTAVADVTAYGYSGRHLQLQVPDVPHDRNGFTGCQGLEYKGWRSDTERGQILERFYQFPGQILEFWILDIDGSRLLIEATRFPDSPEADVAELQAILDSLEIQR